MHRLSGLAPIRLAPRARAFAIRLIALLALASLTACVRPPPPELADYRAAFDESRVATRAFLDVFERYERAARTPVGDAFDPDLAAFEAPGGRASFTVTIERGFDAVARYNAVLASYAAGQSYAAAAGDLAALGGEARLLSAVVGLAGAATRIAPATDLAVAAMKSVSAVADRAALQDAILRNRGKVQGFLGFVRSQTPLMHDAARDDVGKRQNALLRLGRRDEARALDAELLDFRRLLAGWVLTLDAANAAMSALEDAAASPGGASPMEIAFWAGEIRQNAESVKAAARVFRRSF